MKITLKGIVNTVKQVAGIIIDVLPVLRRMVPQIDNLMDKIHEEVGEAGDDAAAWIVENAATIDAIDDIGHRLMDVGGAAVTTATVARAAAANGNVDEQEALSVLRCIDMLRKAVMGLDEAEETITKALKAAQ